MSRSGSRIDGDLEKEVTRILWNTPLSPAARATTKTELLGWVQKYDIMVRLRRVFYAALEKSDT